MFYWILGIVLLTLSAFFLFTYACYRLTFGVEKKHRIPPDEIPPGEQYEARRDQMLSMIHTAESIPFEEVYIRSHDGLMLYGRYYENRPGAPVEILFHGYRSHALRDFSGSVPYAQRAGYNILLVDQRAHGKSGGRVLSFGILERLDVLSWVQYINTRFGKDTPVCLRGMSMGAATVLMASDLPLPSNVRGIVADCPYSSPRAIIALVIGHLGYPAFLYHFIRLGGRLYGGFDIEAHTPLSSLAKTKLPVLFIHGEDDRFVPCQMSTEAYAATAGEKTLFTVPEAGHGLSYLVDPHGYGRQIDTFLQTIGFLR